MVLISFDPGENWDAAMLLPAQGHRAAGLGSDLQQADSRAHVLILYATLTLHSVTIL